MVPGSFFLTGSAVELLVVDFGFVCAGLVVWVDFGFVCVDLELVEVVFVWACSVLNELLPKENKTIKTPATLKNVLAFSIFVFADYQMLNVTGLTLLFKTGEDL